MRESRIVKAGITEEINDFSKMLQYKQNVEEVKWSEYFLNVEILYTNVIYRECWAILST